MILGCNVGLLEGDFVGFVVIWYEGSIEGQRLGYKEGSVVGIEDGSIVGKVEGDLEGINVG